MRMIGRFTSLVVRLNDWSSKRRCLEKVCVVVYGDVFRHKWRILTREAKGDKGGKRGKVVRLEKAKRREEEGNPAAIVSGDEAARGREWKRREKRKGKKRG
ncbi:hypothetical protein HAX54_053221 [Datura stramonium]|uniref:Uncharacterized protein n=1 Tax=Datura stramonium TaxID=4076 RepID=A0ABS8WP90_DATST|nr:hypothetical protein [Datura stramonium]